MRAAGDAAAFRRIRAMARNDFLRSRQIKALPQHSLFTNTFALTRYFAESISIRKKEVYQI